MSVPELRPTDTPIFDDLVVEQMQNHFDDGIPCGWVSGCEATAVARFVVLCTCRKSKPACGEHIAKTMRQFNTQSHRCTVCLDEDSGYRVVPL